MPEWQKLSAAKLAAHPPGPDWSQGWPECHEKCPHYSKHWAAPNSLCALLGKRESENVSVWPQELCLPEVTRQKQIGDAYRVLRAALSPPCLCQRAGCEHCVCVNNALDLVEKLDPLEDET